VADITARGIRFNVMRMGKGEPVVVFVHGLLIDNHASFYMSIAPALAKHASVILYDLRGHGNSEQPPSGYGTDDMAADLAALLDALELRDRRVIVVGHSFGGTIALRFAARFPERVCGLALLEALPDVADFAQQMAATIALTGEDRNRKMQELFGHWLAKHTARGHVDPAAPDPEVLDRDGRALFDNVERFKRRRASPLVDTARRLRDETSLVRDLVATSEVDDAALSRIACPVLALYGEHSDLRADGERLAQRLPQCRLEIIPGCAHGILFHATAQVRSSLLAWMDEVAG
jgi:pimeloyl-ACP methyl ester carboxylesterase